MASTTASGRKPRTAGRSTSRTQGPKKSGSGGRATAKGGAKKSASRGRSHAETDGLHVHTAHASIPIPYVTRKDLAANVQAAESALPDVKLPPPERMAFYGGLGALAVVGALEWPVAAAIGVATVVARHSRREKE